MPLPQVGLEAAIQGLRQFEAGAKTILDAYDGIEKKAGGVTKATGGLSSALSSLGSPLGALGGQFVGLGDNLLKVGAIAGGAALAGVVALGGGIAALTVSGISQAKDLDQQMANIAATMGVTKDAVGPLKDEILRLSLDPTLTVNVTQAADAIQLLGQNGLTTSQILGGAAQSTVAMANATGSDFATAANIATGAMQNFNLQASDLSQVADGITGVLVGTKFSADDYAGALGQAGGVMGGLGVTIQDFNTVLAASAASFTSGSDAGTSFKTLLQRLSNPTDEAKASMEKYGISLFDTEGKMRPLSEVAQQLNDVFQGQATITEKVGGATKKEAQAAATAAKNIDGLRASLSTNQSQLQLYNDQLALEIGYYGEGSPKVRARKIQIEKLSNTINKQTGQLGDYETAIKSVDGAQAKTTKSLVTLTDAQKAELATIIGGADASRTVLALSKLTADQFTTLSGTVNEAGQASKAAATRVDSLSGAWEILHGIIQAIQIQVGDLFLPILRQVTSTLAEMATGNAQAVVGFFNDLISKGQELFKAFTKFGPGGLFAAMGFTGAALFFKKISKLFGLISGDAGSLSKTIQNTVGATFTWLQEHVFPLLSQAVQFVTDHFAEFKGALIGIGIVLGGAVFASLAVGLFGLLTPINLIIAGAALLGAEFAPQIQMVIDKLQTFATVINTLGLGAGLEVIGQMLSNQLATAWVTVKAQLAIWGTQFWDWTAQVYANIPTILTSLVTGIADFLNNQWPVIETTLGEWSAKFWGWVSTAVGAAGTALAGILIAIGAWAASPEAQTQLTLAGEGIGRALIDGIKMLASNSNEGTNVMLKIAGGLLAAIVGIGGILIEIGGSIMAGILAGMINSFGTDIHPWTITQFTEFTTWIGSIDWKGVGAGILVKILEGLQSTIATIDEFWQKSIGGWTGIFTGHDWAKIGKSIIDGILMGINKNTDKVLEKLKEIGKQWIDHMAAAIGFGSPATEFIPLGASIPEGIIAGINQTAPGVAAAMSNLTGSLSSPIPQAAIDKILKLNRHMADIPNVINAANQAVEHFLNHTKGLGHDKVGPLDDALTRIFTKNKDKILGAGDKKAQSKMFADLLSGGGEGSLNLEKLGFGGTRSGIVTGAISLFIDSFKDATVRLKDAQQRAFIQAGRTAVSIGNSLNDIITGSANVLDTRVQTLQALVDSGLSQVNFEGAIISSTEAQQKLNQALLEQKSIQDDLLQTQQNQAKLDFLNKQLDLLDTIKKAGLDPSEILGGLQLGLDASIPDIIAATNRLVQAMVDQVNADLQIASPSKVMAKAGLFTGKGFGLGMLASIPDVMKATQRMISSVPAMIQAPALGGGSGTGSVSNTNFNMTVNTGATPQSVIGQYAIMQAMVG